LALVAMPLAVAAVANLTDVPTNDLISFISALNQAAMPAPQFVEVVRYSPVVFFDDAIEPQFIRFVTTEVDRGIRGETLAIAIADRYRTIGIREIDVIRPPRTIIVDRDEFFPPVVRTRVAEMRAHPHGGPPGQLKKDLGVQTGAEVVHGSRPGERVVVARDSGKGRDKQKAKVAQPAPRRQSEPRVTSRSQGKSKGSNKRNTVSSRPSTVVAAPVPQRSSERRVTKPARAKTTRTVSGNDGRGATKGNANSGGKSKGKGKGKG